MTLRAAREEDADVLTKIVRASSAYPGRYRGIVSDLTISDVYIARETVFVCEKAGRVAGFYSLIKSGRDMELDLMFVSDEFQGQGVGRMLFDHMRVTAEAMGEGIIHIVSNPPAAAFYERMGAIITGTEPPSGRVSWERPRMELRV